MAENPWVKFYTEDFLQGVRLANMTADEIGVYIVLLTLMAARSGPIEHDNRWINGYAGTPSTRKCGQIIDRLIALGKIEKRGTLLGNARMIQTVDERNERSEKARRAALERWHQDPEPELDLSGGTDLAPVRARTEEPITPNYPPKKREDKVGDNSDLSTEIKSGKREKSAIPDNAGAYATRARDSELRESTQPNPSHTKLDGSAENSRRDGTGETSRLEDADLHELFLAVQDASGFRPVSPAQIDRAVATVELWRKEGICFDTVVIPTIKAVVASSSEPTRTLGRFSPRIRHEHARAKALEGKSTRYQAPASPVLEPDDEDPKFRSLRADLLSALGNEAYCRIVNPVRFKDSPGDKRKPLRVEGRDFHCTIFRDESYHGPIAKTVRAHGYKEIW